MDAPLDAPNVRRVSFSDHVGRAAAESAPDDPAGAGAVAAQAVRLAPLHAIQVAFDQVVGVAQARLRGEAWQQSGTYALHFADVLGHAERHARVLAVAAEAARSMVADMTTNLSALEDHMSKHHPDGPRLTPDGSPHPLEAGGYDPDADPQLPSNVSDVAALKEGKTTRKQSEAIAAGDAARAEDDEQEADEARGRSAARSQPRSTTKPPPEPPTKSR